MDSATQEDVQKRLHRIEGQVRGVSKMLDDGRSCQEIIQQLAAIRSAVQQASVTVARSYACQCLADSSKSQDAMIEDLISVLSKAG
jgi:DNA-binding FrmR family transcriptional regulator